MIVDIKLKGVWLKADIEGITVGGGTLDEVLAAGATLTDNRVIDLDGHDLTFNNGNRLTVNSTNFDVKTPNYPSRVMQIEDSGSGSLRLIIGDVDGDGNNTRIDLNDSNETVKFTGKMNNNTLQEFADDAAAVTGGLLPGDFYYTNDAGSGFLKVVLPAI